MEVLIEAEVVNKESLNHLMQEGNEILKIASASRKTVSKNKNQ
jgi:hypothetical protein